MTQVISPTRSETKAFNPVEITYGSDKLAGT